MSIKIPKINLGDRSHEIKFFASLKIYGVKIRLWEKPFDMHIAEAYMNNAKERY